MGLFKNKLLKDESEMTRKQVYLEKLEELKNEGYNSKEKNVEIYKETLEKQHQQEVERVTELNIHDEIDFYYLHHRIDDEAKRGSSVFHLTIIEKYSSLNEEIFDSFKRNESNWVDRLEWEGYTVKKETVATSKSEQYPVGSIAGYYIKWDK